MAKLPPEVQAYIVQQLAMWRKPSLVVKDVKAEFGVTLDRRQVAFYDPTTGGEEKRLAKEWRDLFERTRRAYVEGTVEIGVAHRSYRLAMLHRISERAESQGNLLMAMQALEQAAKETGGLFTNRRKFEIGDPLKTLADLLGVSPDQIPPLGGPKGEST